MYKQACCALYNHVQIANLIEFDNNKSSYSLLAIRNDLWKLKKRMNCNILSGKFDEDFIK